MREMKFRAWDKSKLEMYEVKALGWYIDGMGCNDVPQLQTEEKDERNFNSVYVLQRPYRFELMQYIGLKDINGKEVFEGDVVENNGRNYEVRYDERVGAYRAYLPDGFRLSIYQLRRGWQVIGNVYESPELLSLETK